MSMNSAHRRRIFTKIMERDHWQCQMPTCHHPTSRDIDPALAGTDEDWAPTIDHINRAMRKTARMDTLRAAHRRCNWLDAQTTDQNHRLQGTLRSQLPATTIDKLAALRDQLRQDRFAS